MNKDQIKQMEEFWQKQLHSGVQAHKQAFSYIQSNILNSNEKSVKESLSQITKFLDLGVKSGVIKQENSEQIYNLYSDNFNVLSELLKNSQDSFLNSLEILGNPSANSYEKMLEQFNTYFTNNTKILSNIYNKNLDLAKNVFESQKDVVEVKPKKK